MSYLTAALVFVLLVMVYEVWRSGRALYLSKDIFGRYDPGLLSHHRGALACVGCMTVIMILLIESQMAYVRAVGNPYTAGGALLWFHWLNNFLLVVLSVAIIFRFTGVYDRVWHKRLVYPAIALFATSAATGLYLMFCRLPGS